MQMNDDPAASTVDTVVFAGFALAFIGLAAWVFRPLSTTGGEAAVRHAG